MKNFWTILLNALLFLAVAAGVIFVCFYSYNHSADFQSLFGANNAEVLGPADAAHSLAARSVRAGKFALYIFTGIIVIQLLALFVAVAVLGSIRKSPAAPAVKLAKLANADIFLDLPLYIGLFGSVSSFMVMSFSSSSGQLIAYSSTLIGIIFCTVMRIVLMYPLRSRLIEAAGPEGAAAALGKNAQE